MTATCSPSPLYHNAPFMFSLIALLRGCPLYAGTESQAVCMIDGVEWLAHPGSVGRPVSGEVRIGDDEGRPLPAGEVGEVWMRPPPDAMPYRYLGATARARDGWESHR